MTAINWRSLLGQFDIEGPGEIVCSTFEQMDATEEELGLKLPAQYRNYCQTFGAGEFTRPLSIRFAAPGAVNRTFDLLEFHKRAFPCPFIHEEKELRACGRN